jgi:outer membrane protein OmpA-like peptidoglycan-associated protein
LSYISHVDAIWLQDEEHQLKTGISYFMVREYKLAKLYLTKLNLKSKWYINSQYYLAMIDKTAGKYDEATKRLIQVLSNAKADERNPILSQYDLEINNCKAAIKLKNEFARGSVRRLSYTINSDGPEFAPVSIDSLHLYYSTLEQDSTMNLELGNYEFTTGRIKQAIVQFDDYATDGEIPGLQSDYSNLINGNCEDSGKVMYFTRLSAKGDGYHHTIYSAQFSRNKYKHAKKLPKSINQPHSRNSQPFITKLLLRGKTQKVLFFSSNRPGGIGGQDIWYSLYDSIKSKWTEAINAGVVVNSAKNEITPSYDYLRQQLFFSSDRNGGLGGYDIYGVAWDNRFIGYPENLGHPVNSSFDDSYFSVNSGKYSGFFCSNRPRPDETNASCEDIFEAFLPNDKGIITERPIAGYNGYKPALVIYYPTNEAKPNTAGIKSLDSLIATAIIHRNKYIVVKGHTDNVGSVTFNKVLSNNRVEEILKLLKTGKIDGYRIESAALDMREPRVPYANLKGAELEQARAYNRRVEIYLISK